MKLTDNTVNVFKNFAAINRNILIHEGNVVRTVSPSKTIMAKATIDNNFPRDVCIYELNRFLNTVGLFTEPELEFADSHLTITAGPSKIRYTYADPDHVVVAKKQDLNVTDYIVSVHISAEVLTAVDRARKTLGLEEISIESDGSRLWIKALDAAKTAANSSTDEYALELGECDRKFRAVLKADNMELIPRAYDVSISSKGITHWKGDNIEYWIVLVANKSEF